MNQATFRSFQVPFFYVWPRHCDSSTFVHFFTRPTVRPPNHQPSQGQRCRWKVPISRMPRLFQQLEVVISLVYGAEGWKTVISSHFLFFTGLEMYLAWEVLLLCDWLKYHLLSFRIMQIYVLASLSTVKRTFLTSPKLKRKDVLQNLPCGVFQCFWDSSSKHRNRGPKALKNSVCKGHQPYFRPQPNPAQA